MPHTRNTGEVWACIPGAAFLGARILGAAFLGVVFLGARILGVVFLGARTLGDPPSGAPSSPFVWRTPRYIADRGRKGRGRGGAGVCGTERVTPAARRTAHTGSPPARRVSA